MLDDGAVELKLDDWGWYWQGNQLLPIISDMDVAPKNPPKVIRCNWKTTKKSLWNTLI